MLSFIQFIKESLSEYKRIGPQLGSNEGGQYQHKSGTKHYIKFYRNEDQARSEVLSSKIHEYLGGHTLNPEYVKLDGKHGVKTDWKEGLETVNPRTNLTPEHKKQIGRIFNGSVLTKNWDVVGLEHDNLGIDKKTGNVHILDTGGSFNFRAMGGHKDYGSDIAEHRSLRDPEKNPQAHAIFKNIEDSVLKDSHKKLTPEDHEHIKDMFKKSGISNAMELHRNFVQRADKLHQLYHR